MENNSTLRMFEAWYKEGATEINMLGVPNTLNIAYKQYREQRIEKENNEKEQPTKDN